MASGRPVIAYRGGGAAETIVENKTGIFFDQQSSESLQAAITKFQSLNFNSEDCRKRAEEFNIEIFKNNVANLIKESMNRDNKI